MIWVWTGKINISHRDLKLPYKELIILLQLYQKWYRFFGQWYKWVMLKSDR